MNILMSVVNWFQNLLSGSGKASSKRFAFLAVVVSSIIWLSADLHHNGMSVNWVTAFQFLIGSVVTGYIGGHIVDRTTKEPEKKEKEEQGE